MEQKYLSQEQVKHFHSDIFSKDQLNDFLSFELDNIFEVPQVIDVGGGSGYFAKRIQDSTRIAISVLDMDGLSVERCNYFGIHAEIGDCLRPPDHLLEEKNVVCFNLLLHHLVGHSSKLTDELQLTALKIWKKKGKVIFVNELIYESYIPNASGKIIFHVTKSKYLKYIIKIVSRLAPSLSANTAGVGVRFRERKDWERIFSEAGYQVVKKTKGRPEVVSILRRLLLIKECRRDSFLLVPKFE